MDLGAKGVNLIDGSAGVEKGLRKLFNNLKQACVFCFFDLVHFFNLILLNNRNGVNDDCVIRSTQKYILMIVFSFLCST